MSREPTIGALMAELGGLLTPLSDTLATDERAIALLSDLGIEVTSVPPSLLELGSAVAPLRDAVGAWNAAGDDAAKVVAAAQLAVALPSLVGALQDLGTSLPAELAALGVTLDEESAADVGRRLLDGLVANGLRSSRPRLGFGLDLLGLLESERWPRGSATESDAAGDVGPLELDTSVDGADLSYTLGGDPGQPAGTWTLFRLRGDRLGKLFTDPPGLLAEAYAWGADDFDGDALLARLEKLLLGAGVPARRHESDDGQPGLLLPAFSGQGTLGEVELGVRLTVASPGSPTEKPGVSLAPYLSGEPLTSVDLTPAVQLRLETTAAGALPALVIRPPLTVERVGGGAADLRVVLSFASATDPTITLFRQPGLLELTADRFEIAARVDGTLVPSVEAGIAGGSLRLELGGGDGFLRSLLPPAMTVDFTSSLVWSPGEGLRFSGAASLELELPLDVRIGPVWIGGLVLTIALDGESVSLEARFGASADLGIFVFTIDGVGARAPLRLAEHGGNLGLLHVETPALRPPDRIGVAVDAGVVAGGGYLLIDADAGEYSGILQLRILTVEITAVALVDTKLPGGGWSLFLALFIEVPSIPLGFGFTLTGVGGVAGVNRTLDVEALQSAVRSGVLDSVLFPEDPIADAPIVIGAFQAIFPSAPDRYVFGPVVRIGWGAPILIEAEVAVVLSIPDPITIAVLGSVTSVLPTPDVDLVALHLDVAGVIDTAAGTLSIDASLHDSHIVGFALSGDMALRAAFGNQPSFLLALGGFHPGFDRPAGFPALSRLSLAIDAGAPLDIRFESYFAITSNSLQFGAAFELTAEVEGFGINGGSEFDALVIFSPFGLRTHVGLHVAVTGFGLDVASAWVSVDLTGPNPWYVVGEATVKVLGLDQPIHVDQRIGSPRAEPAPEAEDVLGQLRVALARPEAWRVVTPGGEGVTFAAEAAADDELVLAPDGTLGVSQRVVPLDVEIDKSVPWQIVGGYDRFELDTTGASLASTGTLTDWFAPSSYVDLGPRERLSAPSFEEMESGLAFGGDDATAGPSRVVTLEYEQILRDPGLEEDRVELPQIDLHEDPRAATLAGIGPRRTRAPYPITGPAPVTVEPVRYVAAGRHSGTVLAEKRGWTAARQSQAGRRPGVTVAPSWEAVS